MSLSRLVVALDQTILLPSISSRTGGLSLEEYRSSLDSRLGPGSGSGTGPDWSYGCKLQPLIFDLKRLQRREVWTTSSSS